MKAPGENRFSFWPRALSLQSMRGRMAVLLGLAMLPAGAIAMQVGLNAVSARQAAYEEQLSTRAERTVGVMQSRIGELREVLRVLAASPVVQPARGSECRSFLTEVMTEYQYIAAIAVTNEDGEIRCSMPRSEANARSTPSALRDRAKQRDDFTVGYVAYGRLARQPIVGALFPIRNERQERIGFVGASIGVRQMQQLLDVGHMEDGAYIAIVDYDGRVIAESGGRRGDAPLPSRAAIRASLGDGARVVPVDGGYDVVLPLQEHDLYAVVAWPQEQSRLRRWIAIAFSIAAPLLIWLLAVAAGWFAIEMYVARPLSTLEAAARSMARGEEVVEPPTLAAAPTEIRSLRRTLAAMAKTLRGREQRLVEALGEERALLREIHHRVKNNLQMVASLLNIQARSARDESEAWGLARAHDRVQLLALVHQRIYASGEVRELRLDDLAAEIARQLLLARGASTKDIRLELALDPGRCNADRAVPMAFLIGEALSMALDVLGDQGAGDLKLYLHQDEAGAVRFAVDARGFAIDRDSTSISARLIDAFARQLGANLGRDFSRPFTLWVSVPPDPHAHD